MSFSILSLAACSSTSPDVAKNDVAKEDIAKEERKSNEVHTAQWSYKGETGPEHWGDLNPNFAACTNGKEQSPINIETSRVIEDEKIPDLVINYKPTEFSLVTTDIRFRATLLPAITLLSLIIRNIS